MQQHHEHKKLQSRAVSAFKSCRCGQEIPMNREQGCLSNRCTVCSTSPSKQQCAISLRCASKREVVLQRGPAQCGIPGNENADEMAKAGAMEQQEHLPVSYREKCSLIKTLFKPTSTKDNYHLLPKAEQVTLFRLCTGHNKLNAHMHKKLRLEQSPKCPCDEKGQ